MAKNNLIKEAIADARAVHQAALENARTVLEENLTPRIQNLIAHKLQEMEEYENQEQEDLDEEIDLDELLSELDGSEDDLDEAKKEDDSADDKKDDKPKDKPKETPKPKVKDEKNEPKGDEDDDFGGEGEDETLDLSKMTVEDLKNMIVDIIHQEKGGEGEGEGDDLEGLDDLNDEDDSTDGLGMNEPNAPVDNFGRASKTPGLDEEFDEFKGNNDAVCEDDDMDLDELLREFETEDEVEESQEPSLDEIKKLTNELNEVNLLNAKLLYLNKIFKTQNLSEVTKTKLIYKFDAVTSPKEAKILYESLTKKLVKNPTKSLKENLGFASKPMGNSTRSRGSETLSATDVSRWQHLANIK